jgi:hypothetical protein
VEVLRLGFRKRHEFSFLIPSSGAVSFLEVVASRLPTALLTRGSAERSREKVEFFFWCSINYKFVRVTNRYAYEV